MELANRAHVYRSGSFIRITGIAAAVLLLGGMGIGLTAKVPSDPANWTGFLALLGALTFVIARGFRVGIWIVPEGLVVRSWFKTWHFPEGTIRRCDRVPYWGMLQGAGESWFFWMISLALTDGTTIYVRSTVAPRNTSGRQVAEIASFINRTELEPLD